MHTPWSGPRVIKFPRWLAVVYSALAVAMVPWTLYLSTSLPTRHITNHWDTIWVGFDLGLALATAATAWLGWRQSSWVAISATCLGTLLIADGWFDVLTARPGHQLATAVVLAVVVELPLAVLSFSITQRVMRRLIAGYASR